MSEYTKKGLIIAHDDHDLKPEHLEVLDEALAGWDGTFLRKVIPLPEGCPDIPSALYGPAVGDEPVTEDRVTYEVRGKRKGPSRLIKAPVRPARGIAVVGVQTPIGRMLFTAYGTQSDEVSPREWWDPSMSPDDCIEAATWWKEHALAKQQLS